MFHPIIVDEDGEIQTHPMWGLLSPSAVQGLFKMLNNAPLQVTKIWMNEDDYKDIVEFSDNNLFFDELKIDELKYKK